MLKIIFKKHTRKLISRLPNASIYFLQIKGLFKPITLLKSIRLLNSYFKNFSPDRIHNKSDLKVWKNAFKKYLYAYPKNIELVKSFVFCDLKPIKLNNHYTSDEKCIILICVVKNDLERIKNLYEHHRKLGIKHFVVLDNDSVDGTLEWLLKQPDTDLYSVSEKFSSLKKYGWINRIISVYGMNNWYLYLDSDELLVYKKMEKNNLLNLVNYLQSNGVKRMATITLDMYSEKDIFKVKPENKSIREEYKYFDSNSYLKTNGVKGSVLRGGPRNRVMNNSKDWEGPLLIKHPLFYFDKGDIFESAHYIFPFQKKSFIGGALLHYKFLESDLNRYKKIAKEGNFAGGSRAYKYYITSYKENSNLNFMYEGSVEFKDSESLNHISYILDLN